MSRILTAAASGAAYYARVLTSRHVWNFLTRIDEDIAKEAASDGCLECGGRLHQGSYRRKARGLPEDLAKDARRISWCCSVEGCRSRLTPDSVRYFGRRHYVAPIFLVASVLMSQRKTALSRLGITLSISRRTLQRWRRWWREMFPNSGIWKEYRFSLKPAAECDPLIALHDFVQRRGRGFAFVILRILCRFRSLSAAAR